MDWRGFYHDLIKLIICAGTLLLNGTTSPQCDDIRDALIKVGQYEKMLVEAARKSA